MKTKFKVGDVVEWKHNTSGLIKKFRGTVVACVPANAYADDVAQPLGFKRREWVFRSWAYSRPNPSYLVAVKKLKVRKIHWPLVGSLKKAVKK